MKILIVNYEYPPVGGGGGVATKILAEELANRGHKVTVLTTHFKNQKFRENLNNVLIYRVPVIGRTNLNKASLVSLLTWPLFSIPIGLGLVFSSKFDIINTQFFVPTGITTLIISSLARIPNVIYAHGADVYDPERMNLTASGTGILSLALKYCLKVQARFASGLMAQSNDTKTRLQKIIGGNHKIEIIALPFKPVTNLPQVDKSIPHEPDSFKLVSIGRLVKRKGFNYLIEAMAYLPPHFRLKIVGDGPEMNNLKYKIENLKLQNVVELVGYVQEKTKYELLLGADCFVLSSLHEGMGIVVQEAMQASLPIVSTNVGGQNDLLKDYENAIMVEPAEPKKLANAILKIHNNPELRKKLSSRNGELIKKYYPENIVSEYEKYFESKLKK